MNRHPVRLALCVLIGGLAITIDAGSLSRLAAQTADESSPRLFTDKLEVRVVEVEVVATDKAGNSVTGLTKDDFELYEDGKPVTVTNFYAVDGGREVIPADASVAAPDTEPPGASVTPAPRRQLNLVVFVDNLNTSPLQRNHVIDLVHDQLSDLVGPDDQVMVVTYDRSLHIAQRFCHDLDLVYAALDSGTMNIGSASLAAEKRRALTSLLGAPQREPAPSLSRLDSKEDDSWKDIAHDALRQIHTYAAESANRTQQMLLALTGFSNSLAALPGRRAVLLVSGGIELHPGEELFDLWTQRFLDRLGPEFGVTSALDEGQRYDQNENFNQVLAALRASQVVLYGIGVGGNDLAGTTPVEMQQGGLGAVSALRGFDPLEALRYLAGESGGLALPAKVNSAPVLDRMAEDFSSYYSLAFSRPAPEPGSDHKLEVKVTRPGVHLRYRPAYRAKTIENQAEDSAMTALFHDVTDNPLGVRLELGTAQRQKRDHFLVQVSIHIPFANLLLFPESESHRALLSLVIAVQDGEGRLSRPQHVRVTITIPNDRLLTAMTEEYTYQAQLEMRGGEQKLAVAVADDLASTTSTVNLTVPMAGG
jgi:VWFA-related protein